MEAAAENGIKIIILDRFNPLGNKVEGPQLYNEFSSFVKTSIVLDIFDLYELASNIIHQFLF